MWDTIDEQIRQLTSEACAARLFGALRPGTAAAVRQHDGEHIQ
jgi:hypothetical protein